jgi:hypothetical protein
MVALTYIGGGLLCIGWLVLLIWSLASKSEKISLPSKTRHRKFSKIDTPG